MDNIFEITDKLGKHIRLTKRQYSHILKKHSYMNKYMEEIKETIKNPDKITISNIDKHVRYYYKGYKNLKKPNKYILVIINPSARNPWLSSQ